MVKHKTLWRKSLSLLFCAILIFGLIPITASADTALISSAPMTSYFETYTSTGAWTDLQTPAHWITATGEVAYCLQTSKDNPYNAGYYTIDGEEVYSARVLTGLQAILDHGYPAMTFDFTDEEARYATANAIRFWLAENGADGVPQYLNLNVNGDWIRGKSGYETLFRYSLYLLYMARTQDTNPVEGGTLVFDPDEITLTQDASGQYFTGDVYLNKNISGDYSLMDNAPEGTLTITGHTGTQSETLTLQVPASYANQSCTLCAYGMDEAPAAALFFWAPASANNQRIVTYVLDSTKSVFVRGFLTINVPGLEERKGSIVVMKTDAETGAVLSGVHFVLYDSNNTPVAEGDTDSEGKLSFSGLPLGAYSLIETSAPTGYVLDNAPRSVSITENGQIVEISITNGAASASIVVVKTDAETGLPLSGIHFILADSSGATVGGGTTDENGILTFSGLPLGVYTLTETATQNGYVLDGTPITITLNENGQTVTQNISNTPARGSVSILKTDSETGAALSGVHFELRDEAGALCAEGDTGTDGTLTLPDIPLGSYVLQETTTPDGYVPDHTQRTVLITESGQTVQITVENTPIRGSLGIIKKDVYDEIPLMGAGFRLYDSAGTQVAEGYTNAEGKLSFSGLAQGNYTFREYKAPKGYILDESVHTFTISDVGAPITKTVTNMRRPGTIIVKKQNANGSPLEGAAFLLEYSTDEGSTWKPVFYRAGKEVALGACTTLGLDGGQLITGADGTATFTGLRADEIVLYRLTETKAPPGMTLLADSVLVGTLPVESDNINAEDSEVFDNKAFHYTLEITATNAWQYRLPETGGDSGLEILPFAMMFLTVPIIFIFKSEKKRRITE